MKKFYIIVPLVLTALFVVVYMNFMKDYEQKLATEAAEKQAVIDAELARKQENERIAKADADRRAAERAADEARREAEKRAKWEAIGADIAKSTATFNQNADKFAKEAAELEIQLLELRRQKETANREALELAKRVELARIAKRNAELEIQRMTEMVARRAAESSMARVAATTTPSK